MATVTYNVDTNTITVLGDTSQLCEDIYLADIAAGWGVAFKQGDSQYKIDANLVIGNNATSTIVADKLIQLELNGTLEIKSLAEATFGEWLDGHSKNGCFIKLNMLHDELTYYNVYGKLRLYGCIADARMDGTTQRIYFLGRSGATTDYRETIFNNFRGVRNYNTEAIIFDVILRNVLFGFYLSENPEINWQSPITDTGISINRKTGTVKLYDADTPAYSLFGSTIDFCLNLETVNAKQIVVPSITASVSEDEQLVYKFTFDLLVTDVQGTPVQNANVVVTDITDAIVVDAVTDINGQIPQQELVNRRYYGPSVLLEMKTPHKLKISKVGYVDYEATFEITNSLSLQIALDGSVTKNILTELQSHRKATEESKYLVKPRT